jgi:hypothetical protein
MPFDSYSPLIISTRARSTGGKQFLADGSHYGCCACIGSAGTGLIPLASLLMREDGVAVNLYIPGTVATHSPGGAPLEITPEKGMKAIEIIEAVHAQNPLPLLY